MTNFKTRFSGEAMNRGITKVLLAPALLMVLAACSTTNHHVANVDSKKGELSYYSTSDRRTSLNDTRSADSMKQTEVKLKEHLRKQRTDADAILALANIQVAKGELDAAENNCRSVLRKDLKNKEAKKVLAQIAIRRGKYDLASIFLTSVGGAETKDSNVINMMAMVELQRGNNGQAMALFKQAIKINGNDHAARMNLGVLLVKFRQLPQAAVEFERVLKSVPNHTDAQIHLAIIKSSQGKYSDAEDILEDVLDRDAQNPLALYNLAVVQKAAEKYDDALASLKVYMKSARGRAKDNEQVFALIEDIQKDQSAKGNKVSDEEIQAMASSVVNDDETAAPKKTAAAKPKQDNVEVEAEEEAPVAETKKEVEPELDDVEALEKALAH